MRVHSLLVPLLLLLAACQGVTPGAAAKPVDAARLAAAGSEPGQWLMDGREYNAQRYSPLTQINEGNVKSLGLAWFADLDTFRGVEATPLYVDGVLYNTQRVERHDRLRREDRAQAVDVRSRRCRASTAAMPAASR